MGNLVQAVGAIGGAAIGFVAGGGPAGAAWGFQIGMGIGSLIAPTRLPTQYGPRLGDNRSVTSERGQAVPEVYGIEAVEGFVMWLAEPVEHEKKQKVGKGASQKAVSYSYTQSVAVGLCKYISDDAWIVRVRENGQWVYDVRPQQQDETNEAYAARVSASAAYAEGMVVHRGDDEQLPDPTMEEAEGVGNVPGFRGLMYVVFPDRLLRDDQGLRLPADWLFEIAPSETQAYTEILTFAADGEWERPDNLLGLRVLLIGGGAAGATGEISDANWLLMSDGSDLDDDPEIPVQMTQHVWDPTADGGGGGGGGGRRLFSYTPEQLAEMPETMPVTVGQGGAPAAAQVGIIEPATAGAAGGYSAFGPFGVGDSLAVSVGGGQAAPGILGGGYGGSPVSGPANSQHRGGTGRTGYAGTVPEDSGTGPDGREGAGGGGGGGGVLGASALAPASVVTGGTSGGRGSPEFTATPQAGGAPGAPGESVTAQANVDDYVASLGRFALDLMECGGGGGGGEGDTAADTEQDPSPGDGGQGGYPGGGGGGGGGVSHCGAFLGTFSEDVWEDATGPAKTSSLGGQGADGLVLVEQTVSGPISMDGRAISLAQVISKMILAHGLLSGEDFDVSELEDVYLGGSRRVRGRSPLRDDIESLRKLGLFDVVESDTQVLFLRRGREVVATLTPDDLGATDGDSEESPPAVSTTLVQDVELPARVTVGYRSASRGYETATQASPFRMASGSLDERMEELAVSIADELAAQVAEILQRNQWAEQHQHEVALDSTFAFLRAADPIIVPVDGRNYRCRIGEITDSDLLLRRMTLVREDASNYVSTAVAQSPPPPLPTVSASSATRLLLLDLPMLREEDDNAGVWAAVWPADPAGRWSGAALFRNTGGGPELLAETARAATWGRVDTPAAAGITTTWDTLNELVVTLARNGLESVTEAQLLASIGNTAAVGIEGRWEILRWQSAVQIGPYQYRLTNLLRGRRGTEHNVGLMEAGDDFVLLDDALVRVDVPVAQVGATLGYRAVTSGMPVDSAEDQEFTAAGEAMKPFSPVAITAAWDGPDVEINWVRRSRALYDVPPGGGDVPLMEESELYDVELRVDGLLVASGTVGDTIFASSAGTEGETEVRIYQRSAIVGRGTVGVATV